MPDNALMLYTSFEPIRKISKAKAISVTFIRRYLYIYIRILYIRMEFNLSAINLA